jgi:hypothetical protein
MCGCFAALLIFIALFAVAPSIAVLLLVVVAAVWIIKRL